MNLIEKLGLEKCKQIVEGAPDWSNSYDLKGKDYWKGGVFATAVSIDDLRTAIANHECTDTCTDIKNHISPNTKVIEHEQKPKQEVKHGFYDSNCW